MRLARRKALVTQSQNSNPDDVSDLHLIDKDTGEVSRSLTRGIGQVQISALHETISASYSLD